MPELPEVETVCRQLSPVLVGARLRAIEVYDPKLRTLRKHRFEGRKIVRVFRSAKQIVFDFGSVAGGEDRFLITHLRMTGQLIWSGSKRPGDSRRLMAREDFPARSARPRVKIQFDLGEVEFFDVRRFGTMVIAQHESDFIGPGVEPLSREFSPAVLGSLLSQSRQPVKHWLLRQDCVVGIGNIYASEALFRAGINPRRPAISLSAREVRLLWQSIRSVLNSAIRHNGTTFSDYNDSRGESGAFQRFLKVYDREGERCRKCRETKITRITQQQRSTYFCRTCQR